MTKLEQAAREVIRQHSMECLSDKAVDALREALAVSEQRTEEQAEQRSDSKRMEPVAWWHPKMGAYDNNYFDAMQPLYLSPVRTKDLTDDEIVELIEKHWDLQRSLPDFARAVIAADREKNK